MITNQGWNMKSETLILCIFIVVFLSADTPAKEFEGCPDSIELKTAVVSEHNDWKFGSENQLFRRPYPLLNIRFSSGSPDNGYILHPQAIEKFPDKEETVSTYLFPKEERAIWVVCSYQDTREWLTRRIEASECTITTSTVYALANLSCF